MTPTSKRELVPALEFLNVEECSVVMRVSKMTVYRLIRDRELPATKIGRSFRVQRNDLTEYLNRSKV